MRSPLVLAAAALVLAGCQSLESGAREDFSSANTCPLERVEARKRTDLRPSDLKGQKTPSKEIAADPDRLRMWRDEQATLAAQANDGHEVIEVRGCGHTELDDCHRSSKGSIFCFSRDYPPGAAHW